MPEFVIQLLLAFGGYGIYLGKQYIAALKRNEVFIKKIFIVSIIVNILSIVVLVVIGKSLPPELIVMSPLTCVIIGTFNGTMLAGFINAKRPEGTVEEDIPTIKPRNKPNGEV